MMLPMLRSRSLRQDFPEGLGAAFEEVEPLKLRGAGGWHVINAHMMFRHI